MRDDEPIIEIKGLSKSYKIRHKLGNDHPTVKDALENAFRKPLEIIGAKGGTKSESFYALKDVSFSVKPGEVVGIMGRNGSGKSTLFKILSRITQPTSGSARLKKRSASLLEVGTGFHPELTGRENIYFNGSILGMSKKEIDKKFDNIVAFSEVEKFLDTPIKFYSSGMKVRLAFSVASHLEPDILIIDEVLAVGDVRFKKKSLERMKEIAASGTTILFVSHIVNQIEKICTRGVVLEAGAVVYDGDLKKAVAKYLELNSLSAEDVASFDDNPTAYREDINPSKNSLGLETELTLVQEAGDTPSIKYIVHLENKSKRDLKNLRIAVNLSDKKNKVVTNLNNAVFDDFYKSLASGERVSFILESKKLLLRPGKYFTSVSIKEKGTKEALVRLDHTDDMTIKPYSIYGQRTMHAEDNHNTPVIVDFKYSSRSEK